MAALNTLRTKGSILLTAVIGISLLAFLLGDGTSLFNNTNTSVGTINGKEVSLKEYATEVELMTTIRQFMTGASSLTTEEAEGVQNQVWSKFVSDAVLLPSYKDLGLDVSDAELLDMVNGVYISPIVVQIFTDPQSGGFEKERLTEFVSNLGADQTGRARSFWSFVETQASDNRMNEKFNTLVKEGMYVTSLQVEQALANNSNVYSIDYVTKALSTIADDAVKVTDADLKKYYEKHIARFKSIDVTEVEYVTFDIVPSQEDLTEAEANAVKVANELAESTELEQYVNYTSEHKFDPRYFKLSDLPQYLQEQVATAEVGTSFAPNFENNVYSISRLANTKVMADSITFQGVVVDATKNIDSIINVIKSSEGGFDSVVATLSLSGANETEPMSVNTTMLTDVIGDKLIAAKKGDVVAIDNQGAKNLFKIISVGAPVKKYQIAQVVITVVPSERTEQIIYEKANAFRNEISAGKSFEEVVAANQYIKRNTTVESANREFAQMNNSRELVRWSLLGSNKIGSLSSIVKLDDVNVVAYIKNRTEKGVASFESVKADIRPLYIEKAKMDLAVKELSGATSLESLATSLSAQVGTASDITFSTSMIPGLGLAPEVVGALTSLKEGVIAALPAGQVAAAVKITSKMPNEGMDAEKIKVMLQTMAASYLDSRIGNSISKTIDIKDNRVIYY